MRRSPRPPSLRLEEPPARHPRPPAGLAVVTPARAFWRTSLLVDAVYCVGLGATVAACSSPLALVVGIGSGACLGLGVASAGWGGLLLAGRQLAEHRLAEGRWQGWCTALSSVNYTAAAGIALAAAALPQASVAGRILLALTAAEVAAFGVSQSHALRMTSDAAANNSLL